MLDALDRLVDHITMYRLVVYYLIGLLLAAIGLSIAGDLHYNPLFIGVSATILVVACWAINRIFAYIFAAPVNSESSIITALILALIVPPTLTLFGTTFLLAVAGLAIASKYILTINKRHIFNPAAIAVALTAFGPRQSATWWVGTAVMLPFVLMGGILLTRKIQRGHMVIGFLLSATLATVVYSLIGKTSISTGLHDMVFSSSLFFLAFVMLTEPLTTPPTKQKQTWYAVLVGVLWPPQAHLLRFYSSPELALLAGNILSYVISPKAKLFPILKRKVMVARDTANFVFAPGGSLNFQPGQYMEWTLPHPGPDSRGQRRYFTLASSPTESELVIGVKFYENGSSYKKALIDIDRHTPIVASQIAGDFTMPKDPTIKLAFIAGGIGITPFRSMTKYLVDKNQARDIKLLFSCKTTADVAYRDVLEAGRQKVGLKTLYVINDGGAIAGGYGRKGYITAELIKTEVPDYLERTFYISGTHSLVISMHTVLTELGVHKSHIKNDFFPGYA